MSFKDDICGLPALTKDVRPLSPAAVQEEEHALCVS